MTKPARIRVLRTKGFRLQAASLELNGLPAVRCMRPGKWGNPFIGDYAVIEYAEWLDGVMLLARDTPTLQEIRDELGGNNLGCSCREDAACHCDVLLERANP